jgi:hypothetical protein
MGGAGWLGWIQLHGNGLTDRPFCACIQFDRLLARCRYVVRDASSGEETVLHVTKEQAQSGSDSHLRDPKTGRELEVVDKVSRSVGRSIG